MRFPVCVGRGMRVWTSSKRMALLRHAHLHQFVDHGIGDGLLLAGHAVDGKKAQQMGLGGLGIHEIGRR